MTTIFHRSPPGAKDGSPTVIATPFSAKHVTGVVVIATVMVAVLIVVWRWFAGFLSPVVGGLPIQANMELSAWILVPLAAAVGGWVVAYLGFLRPKTLETPRWRKKLYVFFLNKGYFDEIYDVFLVRPTIKFADWMWRRIDQGIIDRFVVILGSASVGIASWLSRFVETAGISRTVDSMGKGVDASGQAAHRYEPHTLQHNIVVVVFWLIAALGFFYLIVGKTSI